MSDPEVFYQGIDKVLGVAILEWAAPRLPGPQQFRINATSLERRIKNVKERNGDISQEELALKSLKKFLSGEN